MVERVRLRDGTEAFIWPLLPTDRLALKEEYEHLSPESRFHRFLGAVPHLTAEMLDHLVDEVDGNDHVALVLVAVPDDAPDAPAGIARMVRYPDKPSTADVAVTVADAWQGRGVATALLEALKRHCPAGITEIETQVTADNAASIAMLRHLGEVQMTPCGSGCLRVLVHMPDGRSGGPPRRDTVA